MRRVLLFLMALSGSIVNPIRTVDTDTKRQQPGRLRKSTVEALRVRVSSSFQRALGTETSSLPVHFDLHFAEGIILGIFNDHAVSLLGRKHKTRVSTRFLVSLSKIV